MEPKTKQSLLGYEEALHKISRVAMACRAGLKSEKVRLLEARGRILSEDLLCPEDLPASDNAAMDGFALHAADSLGASPEQPRILQVLGEWTAGEPLQQAPVTAEEPALSAHAIMTGAVLPAGRYDTVVKVEEVEVFTQGSRRFIKIFNPVAQGLNIRRRGCDFEYGKRLFSAGQFLQDRELMVLAALGVDEVAVYETIRVAAISTGREIVSYQQKKISSEQVRNSSALFLKSFFSAQDCQVDIYQPKEDRPEAFHELFQHLLGQGYHLLLTTGGVSVGSRDFVAMTLADLGVRNEFHKVAIRPGKPLLFGVHESTSTAVFGLPGNPLATVVGARFFVTVFLQQMRHQRVASPLYVEVVNDFLKPRGLSCFYMGRWAESAAGARVEILQQQGSAMMHSLLEADVWVYLPADLESVKAGRSLPIFPLTLGGA